MRLERLDHVGIAVGDLDAAAAYYQRVYGAVVAHDEVIEAQGVHELLLPVGDSWIQLVQPLGPDTPVGRFLAKRGEGVHHIGYAVADVAAALDELRAEGVELIDQTPRTGSAGTTIAFVHPKAGLGVLVELVQLGSGHREAHLPHSPAGT